MIARVSAYAGRAEFDTSKPNGPLRKLLEVTQLNKLGWKAKIELEQEFTMAYADFRLNVAS